MIRLIYLFPLILCFQILGIKQVLAQNLFPFPNEKGEWGYVDPNGQIKIKHQYAGAGKFHEDRALVIKSKKGDAEALFAVIDPQGNTVFEFSTEFNAEPSQLITQDYFYKYSDGLLLISEPANKDYSYYIYTYYDKQGKIALQLNTKGKEYSSADVFHEGLAYVQEADKDMMHYINPKGQRIISKKGTITQYDKRFCSGLTSAYQGDTMKLINQQGKLADLGTKEAICEFGAFQEGIALAQSCWISDSQPVKYLLVDTKGNTKTLPYYVYSYSPVTSVNGYVFSEGLMWIRYSSDIDDQNYKIGYLNTEGKLVFELPKELSANESIMGGDFEGGLACWVKYSGESYTCYYINKQGKIILKSPEYR